MTISPPINRKTGGPSKRWEYGPNPSERFMDRTEYDTNGGCWLWNGPVCSTGYGAIKYMGKTRTVHRVSYEIHREHPGRLHVLHKCDVKLCVNPAHLFLGTHSDNMQDMCRKGRRTPPVEVKPVAASEVDAISAMCRRGVSITAAARISGRSTPTVRRISRRARSDAGRPTAPASTVRGE